MRFLGFFEIFVHFEFFVLFGILRIWHFWDFWDCFGYRGFLNFWDFLHFLHFYKIFEIYKVFYVSLFGFFNTQIIFLQAFKTVYSRASLVFDILSKSSKLCIQEATCKKSSKPKSQELDFNLWERQSRVQLHSIINFKAVDNMPKPDYMVLGCIHHFRKKHAVHFHR